LKLNKESLSNLERDFEQTNARMEVAEAFVGKSGDLSTEYRNMITENESMLAKQAQEVEVMLLNMEKMRVDKERLRDENFAMKKLNS
jgi:hypothetical protein